MNIFKKIKIELFYLRKLIQPRYPWSWYFSYIKNSWFGRLMLSRLEPWHCDGEAPEGFEMHTMCQSDSVWILYWALRSFMYHSGLCPPIIVHGDGSWNERAARRFEEKFANGNVRVLLKKDATKQIEAMESVPDIVKKLRFVPGVPFLKMSDVYLLSNAKRILIFGNDVMFFQRPDEVVDFAKGESSYDALVSYEPSDWPVNVAPEYAQRYRLFENHIQRMNSDLLMYEKEKIPFNKFMEYFDHATKPFDDYFVEMTGLNALLIQTGNVKILPYERYAIGGGWKPTMVTKHYTGPRRHELYADGIDRVRAQIE